MPANGIPDTAPYLYLGLGAIVTIMTMFIGSIVVRYNNLRRDLETAENLLADERQ
jgi:hypothetical protein